MIFIVGINHRLQWDRIHLNTIEMISYLEKSIEKYKIEVLAEEQNHQNFVIDRFFISQNIRSSTIYDLAEKLSLKHVYCDPTLEERQKLGIASSYELKKKAKIDIYKPEKDFSVQEVSNYKNVRKPYDDIRENYWIGQIKDHLSQNILFVCGHSHRFSFKKKLKSSGFEVKVSKKIFEE